MTLQEIKEVAKQRGVALGKMKKAEIVRAIQEAEGNAACFETGKSADCGQSNCLWLQACQ
jgi:hypothetical protein